MASPNPHSSASSTLESQSVRRSIEKAPIKTEVDVVERDVEALPNDTFVDFGAVRKVALFVLFCLAQFIEVFNNSALFPAIPPISSELSFNPSETVWLLSAYQLAFAAFLLVSGRISDVFSPKPAFVGGSVILAASQLGAGFVHNKIGMLVLRGIGGVGGSLTIPSALSMIVALFPDPVSQARAIAVFGGVGSVGNILGLIIGGLFTEYIGWRWCFYFTAILGGLAAIGTFFLIPGEATRRKGAKFDFIGVGTFCAAMLLFIFAITSGSVQGWASAYVLAPLIISIALTAAFFIWEAYIDPANAALPPSFWRYTNVPALAALSLLPILWWASLFLQLTEWWERYFHWSAVTIAVHFIPLGVAAFIASNIVGPFVRRFEHKYIFLVSLTLALIASIIFPFGSSPDTYWRLMLPAFIIGTIGMQFVYSTTNVAFFASTPPSIAGTVGAIWVSALQLGSAVGLAVVKSIQTSIDSESANTLAHIIDRPSTKAEWQEAFRGRSIAQWFVVGVVAVEILTVLVFYKTGTNLKEEESLSEANPISEKVSNTSST